MLRPRLVIYNMSADKLRPILADAVNSLDAEARWAGESLALPGLGVQLYVDGFAVLRGASLIAAGGKQSQAGWRRLEAALAGALSHEEVARNPRGLVVLLRRPAGHLRHPLDHRPESPAGRPLAVGRCPVADENGGTMRNDEARMTNDEVESAQAYISSFVLRHSFVIRHSCFVICSSFSTGVS